MSTFVLIPMVGLAIDGAVLYWAKAKLSAAVDAAALATGRALNVGQTDQAQIANAKLVGQSYFTANFPLNSLGTTTHGVSRISLVGGAPTISVDESVIHQRIVTVSASAQVMLFFMPILGFNTGTISDTGQATRRDANVMLVLDRSNSMNNNGSCAALKSSAQNFANMFVDGRDQLGLVTFQTGANLDYPPTLTFKSGNPSLNSVLSTLVCMGDTSTAQGLHFAYHEIQTAINQPGSLNVILLFTDGSPNGLVAKFPIKTQADNGDRYQASYWNTASPANSSPASSCSNSIAGYPFLTGVIADGSAETSTTIAGINATGYTVAVLNYAGVPISNGNNPTTISASGCSFAVQGWNTAYLGRQDVAAIPFTDLWGNSTVSGPPSVPALDYFTAGPYGPSTTYPNGQIRPDTPRTTRWASINAADSMALTIRNDKTYAPVIFTIGLAGNETMAMDIDFMKRMANDGSSSYNGAAATNYDPTKPSGKFFMATDNASLSAAFQQVASQILRLSR